MVIGQLGISVDPPARECVSLEIKGSINLENLTEICNSLVFSARPGGIPVLDCRLLSETEGLRLRESRLRELAVDTGGNDDAGIDGLLVLGPAGRTELVLAAGGEAGGDGLLRAAQSVWSALGGQTVDGRPDPAPVRSPAATAESTGFWAAAIGETPEALDLPCDFTRPPRLSLAAARESAFLDGAGLQAIRDQAHKAGCGLEAYLLAAWAAFLSRLCGQAGFVLGLEAGAAGLVPVPVTVEAGSDLAAMGAGIAATLRRAPATGAVDWPTLVAGTRLAPDPSRVPLLPVVLSCPPAAAFPENGGAAAHFRRHAPGRVQHEITLLCQESGQGLEITAGYLTQLFRPETIRNWLGGFRALLAEAAARPGQPVDSLPLLSAQDRAMIVSDWNATARQVPATALEMIESQVDRTPDSLAVRCAVDGLTYRELDEQANHLARRILASGVRPGDAVGICLSRGVRMSAAILGVWKAGCAYVPLDPGFPRDRLHYIVEDAAICVLLTERPLAEVIDNEGIERIWIDADAAGRAGRVPHGLNAGSLAYILHTSGSTGKPKGVQIGQGNLANFLAGMAEKISFTDRDILVAVTTLSFDIAGLELLLPLTLGAQTLVATREDALDGHRLAHLLERGSATVLQATPATWQLLVAADWRGPAGFKALCGGEALPRELARELLDRGCELWNVYGPTETTIWSSLERIVSTDEAISIGRPIANTRMYVVDPNLRPVPIGASGELLIGGMGVSRGYLNRPELTRERFLPDPFLPEGGQMVYRTGDICRFDHQGRIFFQRRNDSQVKVRGYRIELGEIESALEAIPGVKQAVVQVKVHGDGDVRLVGYVVPHAAGGLDAAGLQALLGARLPPYMVPRQIALLPSFPLTPNGKIDRKALPDHESPASGDAAAPVREMSGLEATLVGLWRELLRVERVGPDDNFFDLGGHSMLAARLVARLRERLGAQVPMRTVFESPTVAALAAAIGKIVDSRGAGSSQAPDRIPRLERRKTRQLSPTQERNLFAAQNGPGLPAAVTLKGPLSPETLHRALETIVARHAVLRGVFENSTDGFSMRLTGGAAVDLPVSDLGGLDPSSREAQLKAGLATLAGRSFDLEHGPLFRFKLFKLSAQSHVFAFCFSQLVFDGLSHDIFLDELSVLYAAFIAGRPDPLPPLPVDYLDYIEWRNQQLSAVGGTQTAWWKQRIGEEVPAIPLPTDRPHPDIPGYQGDSVPLEVDHLLAQSVSRAALALGATPQMVYLSALFVLSSRLGRRTDCWIASPVDGRVHPYIDAMIGAFANVLPLRCEILPGMTTAQLVDQVRDLSLSAMEHQDLPLYQLGLRIKREHGAHNLPLFQMEFGYQRIDQRESALGPMSMVPVPLHGGNSPNDITVTILDSGASASGSFEFSTAVYDRETVEHWRDCYLGLLRLLAGNLDRPLEQFGLPAEALDTIDRVTRQSMARLPSWLVRLRPLPEAELRIHDDAGNCVPLGTWGNLSTGQGIVLHGVRLRAKGIWERLPQVQGDAKGEHGKRKRVLDAVEFRVLELFQKTLGLKEVGLQDSFFDLGGHSTLAVKLMGGIQQRFGLRFSLAILFKAPTPYELAKVIRREAGLPDPETGLTLDRKAVPWNPIVDIHPEGSLPPLFMAAGVGGNPMNLRFIAQALGGDQPFYGLQHRGTDGRQRPYTLVEDMARDYCQHIRKVQPHGPYYLGGFSAGGIAAFEVAREMLRQGETVGLVVMFDANSPVAYQHAAAEKSRRQPRSPGEFLRSLPQRAMNRGKTLLEKTGDRLGAILARFAPFTFRIQAVTVAWYNAARNYVPTPLAVDVLVLRANERTMGLIEPSNGWAPLVTGRLEVRNVPGDHLSHIEEPHVHETTRLLQEALRASRSAKS
jgi:amino acid adenylation domain-containing protein